MGKVNILTSFQRQMLAKIGSEPSLTSKFYFTGGTALSEVYFQHRESEDLDFFSDSQFDSGGLLAFFNKHSQSMNFSVQSRLVEPTFIFELKQGVDELKVDFAPYPYPRIEKSDEKLEGVIVDSLPDIATNKFVVITQRKEIKDFVDLYYILQKYNFWQLRDWAKAKFRLEVDAYTYSADLIAVTEFDYLPKMLKPLTLEEVKTFFLDLSKKLSRESLSK